jgi:hypothetical protein
MTAAIGRCPGSAAPTVGCDRRHDRDDDEQRRDCGDATASPFDLASALLWAAQLIRFFRALAAENLALLLAAIAIVSPVAGLRPSRAARLLTLNLPNPARETSPPLASWLETASRAASTACFA